MKLSHTIVFVVLALISCSKKVQKDSSEKYRAIAVERFGIDQFECIDNEDSTLVLCKQQINSTTSTIQSWDFFIYNKIKDSISYSDKIDKGSVKWFSNNEIQISKVPGTMAQGQTMDDYAWIIDLRNGMKTKKSDYKKSFDH
jgi:hypothetical protein